MRARGRSSSACCKAGEIDKRHGARVRYANPITGGPVLPTMGAWLAMLPKGFKGEPYRATDGTIFVCVEGSGSTTVDGEVWNGARTTSSWCRRGSATRTTPPKRSVLFSISDRPAQEALGIWREGNRVDHIAFVSRARRNTKCCVADPGSFQTRCS